MRAASSLATISLALLTVVRMPAAQEALRKELGADAYSLVLKINRLDLERDLSPAPRLLVVSRRVQAFATYEDGVLVRWGVAARPHAHGTEIAARRSG